MSIENLWKELERQPGDYGTYRRRIHPEAVADLYLVVHKPENQRALLIDVDLSAADVEDLPRGEGIDLDWLPRGGGGRMLQLVLVKAAFADLFNALVTDVATAAAEGSDERDVVERVAGRVSRWQKFLREASRGLSEQRQRGLYGELYFMRQFLIDAVGPALAVDSWTGPASAQQDYSLGSMAVEVKTTMAKQHQVLRISSERQLDTTGLDHLAVFHLSVDEREGPGQTLPALVDLIRNSLPLAIRQAFDDKLLDAGYHESQTSSYVAGYTVREANVFDVAPDFPRLVESDCPVGVGDVSYSLAVSALAPFLIDANRIRQWLQRSEHDGD